MTSDRTCAPTMTGNELTLSGELLRQLTSGDENLGAFQFEPGFDVAYFRRETEQRPKSFYSFDAVEFERRALRPVSSGAGDDDAALSLDLHRDERGRDHELRQWIDDRQRIAVTFASKSPRSLIQLTLFRHLNQQIDSRMIVANWQPVKEPRGFIRIIQILFALIAFATTGGFNKKGKITAVCPETTPPSGAPVNHIPCVIDVQVEYPFRWDYNFPLCGYKQNCSETPLHPFKVEISYGTSSEFYVTTGILSFLYASFALAFYTFGSALYDENPILPFFDLLATGLLTMFWFLGWIAWVTQVGNIKDYYHSLPETLCNYIGEAAKCTDDSPVRFSRLTVSLISGFGSIILWAGSSWFVYKETHLFKKNEPVHYGSDMNPNLPPL